MRRYGTRFLLSGRNQGGLALAIQRHGNEDVYTKITNIPIHISNDLPNAREFLIDENVMFSPSRPALILATSGTTLKSKGMMLPRKLFYRLDKPFLNYQKTYYLALRH